MTQSVPYDAVKLKLHYKLEQVIELLRHCPQRSFRSTAEKMNLASHTVGR